MKRGKMREYKIEKAIEDFKRLKKTLTMLCDGEHIVRDIRLEDSETFVCLVVVCNLGFDVNKTNEATEKIVEILGKRWGLKFEESVNVKMLSDGFEFRKYVF
jgi:hypothetical protein